MRQRPHIIILGGGLIGLSCADSFISGGARVTIIEKQSQTGFGAGRYNSGMIHPSQARPWMIGRGDISAAKLVFDLAQKSKILLQNRRKVLGCLDRGRPAGCVQLFDRQFAAEKLLGEFNLIGVKAQKYEGKWGFQRYALHYPEDQSGDASHYCELLVADLLRRNCEILCGFEARLELSNGICSGVNIAGKTIAADHVIVACGAQSSAMLKFYNIEVPIVPMTGHALCYDRPEGLNLPDIPIMHWDSRSAMTIFGNQIRFSGTIGKENPAALLEIWEEIAPDIVNALPEPTVKWSADRPASLLGRPIISQTPISNLWINSGHGHMGWSLCAASGELMADMILKGKAAPEFALQDKLI